ncbi:hypothetical protein BS47DRAFT_601563 [Hydnum rufescens UP504]|uniref:Uncharacterized protein n=1 Tax=Hydnum rufescens UP504 TaxID=1448309 RepID=A0A9P6AFQ8_9AGAM|nr:hypothetical protein BS47DRAFT_601563 [Hydnum rufescens UP504]
MCTSLSHLILLHYFQYEFDRSSSAGLAAMRASRGPIRKLVPKFSSGPIISSHWVAYSNRLRVKASGEQESTNSRIRNNRFRAKASGEQESTNSRNETPILS